MGIHKAFYTGFSNYWKGKRVGTSLVVVVISLTALILSSISCTGDMRSGDIKVQGIAELKGPAFPQAGHFVEIFNEMHYQPSYRSQEGMRILPPANSVPVTGKELEYRSLAAHEGLEVPQTVTDNYDINKVSELYRTNCLVCHGETLAGDGRMGQIMSEKGLSPVPANLNFPETQDATEADLFAFISWGGRMGSAANFRGKQSTSPMPQFRLLLSESDRWALVKYVLDQ